MNWLIIWSTGFEQTAKKYQQTKKDSPFTITEDLKKQENVVILEAEFLEFYLKNVH